MAQETPSIDRTGKARLWLLVFVSVILGGWALKEAGSVLIPVVFSIFLALVVAPLDSWVREQVPPKFSWLGHLAALMAMLLAILVFIGLAWFAAQQFVTKFPSDGDGGSFLAGLGQDGTDESSESGAANNPFGNLRQLFSDAGVSVVSELGSAASGVAMRILGAAGTALGTTVLVLFLTLIMLIEAPVWRRKIATALDPSADGKAMESAQVIAGSLRRYLLARTIIGLITAALYAFWLWLFGIDLLVVWFLLAFLLNYIPTLGSLVAGLLPALFVFTQKDVGTAVAVAGGLIVIEQIMGNFVDPRLQGRNVSLSALVILVSLLIWGWIWGIAGALLAVPMTIAIMVISAHVRVLRPFALMLSNEHDIAGLREQTTGSS